MEEPQELVSKHIRFYPSQLSHLERINNDISVATRKLVEKDMNQKKNQFIEKYMVLFAIGLLVITFATLQTIVVFMAVQMAIGVVFLVHSVMRIFLWRLNHEMATRTK
jgi:succinate-acetate transporter protein